MHPLAGIGLILFILVSATGILRYIQAKYAPHPELVRKLLHISMGLTALSFPWFFQNTWPVLILALLSLIFLILQRISGPINKTVGRVLLSVGRDSLGDLVFPVSITILFYLSHKTPLLFCVPVLILTLADAVSALVGLRYGFTLYTTGEGNKSVEGSLAFFLMAFLSIHVPILLYGDGGRLQSVLIGVNLGLLVMMLEAVAWMGLDNLFIPLGGYMLLKSFLSLGTSELLTRLLLIIIIFIVILLIRKKTTLNDSAALGAALGLYVFWSVGGWPCLVAPLILMLLHTVIWPVPEKDRGRHTVAGIISVTLAGFIWLFIWTIRHREIYLQAFNISFAIHLAIIGIAWLHHKFPGMSPALLLASALFKGWLFIILPSLLFLKGINGALYLFSSFIGIGIGSMVYWLTHPRNTGFEMSNYHWSRQGIIAFISSLIGVIAMNAGGIPL